MSLLRSVDHPGLPLQERQHAFFEQQIERIGRDDAVSRALRDRETLGFLRDWFLEHILNHDRLARTYLTAALARPGTGKTDPLSIVRREPASRV
jgi:hemerythrin